MSLDALNLFDLADNDGYLARSRRSYAAVQRHHLWWAFERLDDLRPLLKRR